MAKVKLLIVDDEIDIQDILEFNLEKAGFDVDCAASAEEALKKFNEGEHKLILLDVMMKGMSGFDMAKVLRTERGSTVPIIFLTAKNAEKDMLKGFSAGGDDYISKPFSINEVVARVKAVLWRTSLVQSPSQPDSSVVVTGKIKIDTEKKTVYINDKQVAFSKKEFEILSLLATNEGKIFSREDLITELWKDAPYVLDRTVDVHIARIRAKLGECKKYLTNRSGYGYCFKKVEP